MLQTQEQVKNLQEQLNEEEIGNPSEQKFRVKMLNKQASRINKEKTVMNNIVN